MPTPAIANIWRVVLLWDSRSGVTPRNVFHVFSTGADEGVVAGKINDAFDAVTSRNRLFSPMTPEQECNEFSVQKLDGASAALDFATTSALHGNDSGDVIPAACFCVSLKTGQIGPRGRGRMYVGPIVETTQTQGVANPTVVGLMTTAWEQFINQLRDDLNPLVIASYTHADAHDVTSVRVDTLIATQRRRQDQLR